MFSANNNKMFCKVCYDAGKPEWEYTSHYVKDQPGPNGKVVCPVLLNVECNYCHVKGHTPTHCPKLKERNEFRHQYQHDMSQYIYTPTQYTRTNMYTPPENPPVYDFHGPRSQPRKAQRKRLDLNTKPSQHTHTHKHTQPFNMKNFYDILEKTMQESRPSSPTHQNQNDYPSLTPTTEPKLKTTPNSCWGKKMSCEEMTNHLRSLILKHTPKKQSIAPPKPEEYTTNTIKDHEDDILSETDDTCSEELEYSSEDDTLSQSSTNSFIFKKSWADIMEEEEKAAAAELIAY